MSYPNAWEKFISHSSLVMYPVSCEPVALLATRHWAILLPNKKSGYIDLSSYQNVKIKIGAGSDFAQAYVVLHEVGLYVQNLLGY
jgi:predicted metalloprotease